MAATNRRLPPTFEGPDSTGELVLQTHPVDL